MARTATRPPGDGGVRIVAWSIAVAVSLAACGNRTPRPQSTAQGGLRGRPHVTIAVATDLQATIKPCGCTVDLQKGGVERIGRWLADLRQSDDSVLLVHAGSLLHDAEAAAGAGRAQLDDRRATFAAITADLGLGAAAWSGWDAAEGGTETAAAWRALPGAVVGVGAASAAAGALPSVVHRTASGLVVAVVALDQAAAADPDARHALAQREVARARAEGAQVVVALANLGLRGARRLARAVAGIDVVVAGDLDPAHEPSHDLDREGDAIIVHAGRHGAWFGALTLAPGQGGGAWVDAAAWLPDSAAVWRARREALQADLAKAKATAAAARTEPLRRDEIARLDALIAAADAARAQPPPPGRLAAWRLVGLPWSAPVDPRIAQRVRAYDDRVAARALQIASAPVPIGPGEPSYIGQGMCMTCHMPVQAFAMHDPHGKAWATLERQDKARDLDCVPCHVTAWQAPGGSAFANLASFHAVQCEACHGAGSHHAATAAAGDASPLPAADEAVCRRCHTADHSPGFEFAGWRARLIVPGHGAL